MIASFSNPEAAKAAWDRRMHIEEAGGERELVEEKTEEVLKELRSGKDPMSDPAIRQKILERSGVPQTLKDLAEKHKNAGPE
jgi:hypothetical protein